MPKFIPIEQFGKDHWSTFAYIECQCVDNGGVVNSSRMRTDGDRRPWFGSSNSEKKYPTRLKGYFENSDLAVSDHDDWDCAIDLEKAGLLKIEGTGLSPIFKLTDKGKIVAARLRSFKADGGNFAQFEVGSI